NIVLHDQIRSFVYKLDLLYTLFFSFFFIFVSFFCFCSFFFFFLVFFFFIFWYIYFLIFFHFIWHFTRTPALCKKTNNFSAPCKYTNLTLQANSNFRHFARALLNFQERF